MNQENNRYLRNGQVVYLDPLTKDEVCQGIRGTEFKKFLRDIFRLSSLDEKYIRMLINEKLHVFEAVFTHSTAGEDNYEFYEFIGDSTLNKCVTWYLSRKFPKLQCKDGVKILTRLKMNLISKKSFATFAKDLNFWDYVSASNEVRMLKMMKTLEDVFESFFGAFEMCIDEFFSNEPRSKKSGYYFCFKLASSLLDKIEIKLNYENLFDAKTRLKELVDFFKQELKTIKYQTEKKEDNLHYTNIYLGDSVISNGTAPLKIDSEQIAADKAVKVLRRRGIYKPLPEIYKNLT